MLISHSFGEQGLLQVMNNTENVNQILLLSYALKLHDELYEQIVTIVSSGPSYMIQADMKIVTKVRSLFDHASINQMLLRLTSKPVSEPPQTFNPWDHALSHVRNDGLSVGQSVASRFHLNAREMNGEEVVEGEEQQQQMQAMHYPPMTPPFYPSGMYYPPYSWTQQPQPSLNHQPHPSPKKQAVQYPKPSTRDPSATYHSPLKRPQAVPYRSPSVRPQPAPYMPQMQPQFGYPPHHYQYEPKGGFQR